MPKKPTGKTSKKRRLRRPRWLDPFALAGLYFLIVAIGLVYGLFQLQIEEPLAADREVVMISPETLQLNTYRRAARDILAPFLEQAVRVEPAAIAELDPAMLDLTTTTRERLLRLTVPASARDTHLAFILMLDRWTRALQGSPDDADLVVDETSQLVTEHTWLAVSHE